jgi:ParB family chromosome partitioning protein
VDTGESLFIEVPPAMQAEITTILREFRHEADETSHQEGQNNESVS